MAEMTRNKQITLRALNSMYPEFKAQARTLIKEKGIPETQSHIDLIVQQLLKNYMVSF